MADQLEAREGGPARGHVGEGRRRVRRHLDAQPPGDARGERVPLEDPLRRRRGGSHALRAALEVREGAVLLEHGRGGDDRRRPSARVVLDRRHLEGEERAAERRPPALAVVPVSDRVGPEQDDRLDAALLGRGQRLVGRGRSEAGGLAAELVGGARRSKHGPAACVGDVRQDGRDGGAHRPGPDEDRRRVADGGRQLALVGRGSEELDVRGAGPGGDVVRAAERLEARAARADRHDPGAGLHGLADPELDDGCPVGQVGVAGDDDGAGAREVGDRGRVGRERVPARGSLRPAHRDAAAEALVEEPRPGVGLLVGLLARGEDGDRARPEPLDGGAEPVGDVIEGVGRGDLLEPAAAADEALRDALVARQEAECVAALVAEPALVDLGVVAREHAHHVPLPDVDGRVAADGAEAAHARDLLRLPGAGAEPVGRAR